MIRVVIIAQVSICIWIGGCTRDDCDTYSIHAYIHAIPKYKHKYIYIYNIYIYIIGQNIYGQNSLQTTAIRIAERVCKIPP